MTRPGKGASKYLYRWNRDTYTRLSIWAMGINERGKTSERYVRNYNSIASVYQAEGYGEVNTEYFAHPTFMAPFIE
jgi:hypothetical protein